MSEAKRYENFIGGREGTEFEWDIFGTANTKNQEYQKEIKKVAKSNGFVFFRDAMKLTKEYQPGDPRNPGRPFARDLRIEVIDQLGLTEEKDMDRIKFYTAIGTPLDRWHGIDGFFEIEQEQGPPILITLDATTITAEEKIRRGQEIKADIVVSEKEVNISDEEKLPEKISGIAEEVIKILEAKREQNKKRENSKQKTA